VDHETLLTIQGYAKFAVVTFVFVIFYAYAYSIYKRDKEGERDFEKYSDLVLDDGIESKPLEKREKQEDQKEDEKNS
jgi:cytochrome c oxidase cbb3-type subunit 4